MRSSGGTGTWGAYVHVVGNVPLCLAGTHHVTVEKKSTTDKVPDNYGALMGRGKRAVAMVCSFVIMEAIDAPWMILGAGVLTLIYGILNEKNIWKGDCEQDGRTF